VGEVTDVLREAPLTMVVEVLLSKEYPIAEIACDEQLGASAESVKGEETWAPFPGLLTVTVANAGLARRASTDEPMKSFWNRFMKDTSYAPKIGSCRLA
jgi:hypothetical protein